jgi:4-amino-4-deoxy-L-arabinose transferase-like glycosyltransferase
VCALLAFLNAVCWSILAPPFQSPDEPDHFAYVQQLAENGHLPHLQAGESFSEEESAALSGLRQVDVLLSPSVHTIADRTEERALDSALAGSPTKSGSGGAGVATSEPPLYYALETVPYGLGSGGTILERLELMRLMSALMAAFTALFVFMFLREALPDEPWAWTVGGLGVALAPLLGFVSGVVNPDAMLFAVSSALFFCLARAFRRGLTQVLALAIGAVIAVGFTTKLNFIGLAPGAVLGLALLSRREAHTVGNRAYYRLFLPALLVALSPVVLYALVNVASGHPAFGIVSSGIDTLTGGQSTIPHELGYVWQVYLPRLPWMHDYFGDLFTTRQIWFNGLVGLYGWVDTVFPTWAYRLALVPMGLICVLCIRELIVVRKSLRDRIPELVTYATMTLGVLVLVGASSYQTASTHPGAFTEPRYLLPMLALWGAALALAARGAGRRWGPAVGALIVILVLAHDILSQLQVVARYYG